MFHPSHVNATVPIIIVGDELPPGVADPDELAADAANSSSPYHLASESIGQDLSHAWAVAHEDYDNGKMDGFVAAEGRNPPWATIIELIFRITGITRIIMF